MEYMTPNFTKDMVKTHKILIPNMAVTQFRLMQAALASEGYQTEVLGNCGSEVAQLGLKYVHNDTCYPALLVIGQFLDALNSGKYDLDHTALLITQTGGGCRASNYIKLLRKALVKAGYGNIPVASLNFSGLEKGSGLPLTVPLLRKVIASIFYGDMLVALRSQTHAYENHRGDADAMTEKWISTIQGWIRDDKNYSAHDMKRRFYDIAADYATIPITRVPKVKVGVVGEIYVKYSPLGNNDLEKFLESQDCEVNLPGLMGFVEYCVANYKLDIDLYGGNKLVAGGADAFLSWLDGIGCASYDAMRKYGFYAPGLSRQKWRKYDKSFDAFAEAREAALIAEKESEKPRYSQASLHIAVVGAQSRIGTTSFALRMAEYFRSRDGESVVVCASRRGAEQLEMMETCYEEAKLQDGIYTINGIDISSSDTDTAKVYNAEIYDFGNKKPTDFSGFDKIYVIGGTSWNELPMIYDIQNDLNMVNYTVAVNFSDETSVEKNRELLSVNLNDVICLPYAPDPFSLTAGYEEIFDKDFVEWADSPAEEADLSAEK